MSISFYWLVLQFLYMLKIQKKNKFPRVKTPVTAWGKTPMRVGVLPDGFFQLESCHKLAIIVAINSSNSIYMSDMEMQPTFLQTLIESLASIHDIIPKLCGRCFQIRR